MKKNLSTILLLILWGSILGQQTPAESSVIETIQNESDAYIKRDYDKWSNTWLQDETASLVGPDHQIYNGFKEISEWVGIKKNKKSQF